MNLDDDLDIASMECPDKQQSDVYSGIHNSESSNVGEPTLLDRIYEELSPQLSLLSNVTIPCTPPKNLSPSSTFCDAMGNPQLHTAITCSPPSVPLQPFSEPLHPVNKELVKSSMVLLSPSVAEVNDNCETSSNISSSNISSKVREEQVSKNDAPTTLPSRHKAKSWSIKDDITLKNAVMKHGEKCWALMSSHYFDMRFTPAQCRSRWTKCINPELKKGKWTVEEDRILMECVERGVKKWSEIAKYIPGRQGKQVKERWANHLMPGIKKEKWSEEELKTLITEQRKIGNKVRQFKFSRLELLR